jgi:hypothetical protein
VLVWLLVHRYITHDEAESPLQSNIKWKNCTRSSDFMKSKQILEQLMGKATVPGILWFMFHILPWLQHDQYENKMKRISLLRSMLPRQNIDWLTFEFIIMLVYKCCDDTNDTRVLENMTEPTYAQHVNRSLRFLTYLGF